MSRTSLLSRLVLPVACMIVSSMPAVAQYNASLQGTITDTTGAVIPDATITLTDTETNRTLTAKSGAGGDFAFNQLAPSVYRIVATKDGFQSKQLDNVKIISEQANALNLQLQAGGATTTVTVNAAEKPLIDTQTGSISGTIDQQAISKLPSSGRDVFQLVQLAPGVFGDGSQSGDSSGGTNAMPGNNGPGGSGGGAGVFTTENRPQASANGGRTDQNNVTLDGTSINSVTWQGAAVITPSEDSIKEVKVSANSYDATFGRAGAAQIQALSQNGTNTWHGTAFFQLNRPGLNAYQRWDPNNNPQRNTQRFNQFGGTVGGPIWKDRIFFFFSYESIRNNSTATSGGWYDTPSFDASAPTGYTSNTFLNFKGAAARYSKILEGAGDNHVCSTIGLVEGTNCHFIEGQGLDVGRPLVGFARGAHDPSYVNPANPGLGGDGTGSPSNLDGKPDLFYISTTAPSDQVAQQFSGRLDFQVTQKDLVAFNIYNVPVDNTNFNGPSRDYNLFHHNQVNYAETILWNHIFSPTWLNEARVNAAGWKWNELTSNPQSPLGLPVDNIEDANGSISFGSLPTDDSATGYHHFGPSAGSVFNQNTYSIRDTVTKVLNSHNIRFGGEATKLEYLDEPTWEAQPSYNFLNLWDFVNDAPVAENVTADPRTGIPSFFRKDLRSNLGALFIQDDWKVKPNLTVNLGMRWDYFGSLYEKKDQLSSMRLGSGAGVLSGAFFKLGGDQTNPRHFNFGPQLGFAWSPMQNGGRLVIRGGAGIAFSYMEIATTSNSRFNPPFVANGKTLTGSQIVYAAGSNPNEFGTLPSNPYLITPFNAQNLPATLGVSLAVNGIPIDEPTNYTYRYSLEAQYDLGRQWVGTLGYQGSLGRHNPIQTNLNSLYAASVSAGLLGFNPKLNSITWNPNSGTSNFHALNMELQHQFSHTFQVDTQYRFAKSIDDGSNAQGMPDYIFQWGHNRGPSDYDIRNSFKLWGLWSPLFFGGNHSALEKIVGGWTFSGIANAHSGFPYDPIYSGLGSNAVIPNNGQGNLPPGAYLGGAGRSQSTDTFKQPNGNFTRANGNADGVYFHKPTVTNYMNPDGSSGWPTDGSSPIPTALPSLPGIARNSFFGPRYFDVDFTATKAFGLPRMPVLGEDARFEIRANAFNLFNKLNLFDPQTDIGNSRFGQAQQVLGARTINLEAHFKF